MTQIQWQQVRGPDFGDSIAAYKAGADSLDRGLATARTGLKDWEDRRNKEASNSLMADLMTKYQGDPAALQAAAQSGELLRGYKPGMLSPEAIAAIGGRTQDLQNFQLQGKNIEGVGLRNIGQGLENADRTLKNSDYALASGYRNSDMTADHNARDILEGSWAYGSDIDAREKYLAQPEVRARLKGVSADFMGQLRTAPTGYAASTAAIGGVKANTALAVDGLQTNAVNRDQTRAQTRNIVVQGDTGQQALDWARRDDNVASAAFNGWAKLADRSKTPDQLEIDLRQYGESQGLDGRQIDALRRLATSRGYNILAPLPTTDGGITGDTVPGEAPPKVAPSGTKPPAPAPGPSPVPSMQGKGPLNSLKTPALKKGGNKAVAMLANPAGDVGTTPMLGAASGIAGAASRALAQAFSTPASTERFLGKVATAESGGNPNAANSRSSADGTFQFTDGTWAKYHRQVYGGDGLKDKFDPQKQVVLMRELTKDNSAALSKAGLPVNDSMLYAAHHFGAQGAIDMARNPRGAVPAAVQKANPPLRGMNNAQALNWVSNHLNGQGSSRGGAPMMDADVSNLYGNRLEMAGTDPVTGQPVAAVGAPQVAPSYFQQVQDATALPVRNPQDELLRTLTERANMPQPIINTRGRTDRPTTNVAALLAHMGAVSRFA